MNADNVRRIVIAKEFSASTGGRVPAEGPFSGEDFRLKILIPCIQEGFSKIIIDLDGTDGYGSSFLEESFAGLVRAGYSADFLLNLFIFKSIEDESYIDEIKQYIIDAENRK